MKKKLYHVLDQVDNRHWIVIAKSDEVAREKVLANVPDLKGEVIEVNEADQEDFIEITAEIKVVW